MSTQSSKLVAAPSQVAPAKAVGGAFGQRPWPKRNVSEPGDPLEREADAVAESVMRSLGRGPSGPPAFAAPPLAPSGSGGQPLPDDLRRELEPRLGFDFSRVRIYADSEGAASADALEARAYTKGSNIVFAAGSYAPATWEGKKLLAHELAHVAQQGQAAQRGQAAAPAGQIQRMCTSCAEEEEGVIQRQARRPGPPRARAPARPAVGIVEDGQPAAAGQMHRSEVLAALGSAITQGCDLELAPFGRSSRDCPVIARSLAHYARWPAASLARALQKFGRVPAGTNARGLIAGAVARAREMARRLATADQRQGGARPQAMAADRSAGLTPHRPAEVRARLGEGRPLDEGARGRMEGSFGRSFADVRVHTGDTAARVSRELGARAFTVGRDIAFAAGEYRPGSRSGDQLLAHELAHAVQQGRGGAAASPSAEADRELEREADRAAASALDGRRTDARAGLEQRDELRIQRWPAILAGLIATAEVGGEVAIVDGVVTVAAVEGTTVAAVSTELVVAGGTEIAVASTPAVITAAAPTAAAVTTAASSSSVLTTAAAATGIAATTTLSSDSPTHEEDTRRRNQCRETHPSALECTWEGSDVYEVAALFLAEQGRSIEDLGTCSGFQSFGEGAILACNGAPGETWHCGLRGSSDEISIFGCLCCHADGTSSYEFTGAHWSVNVSRRGGR